jgi:hypothetical protein
MSEVDTVSDTHGFPPFFLAIFSSSGAKVGHFSYKNGTKIDTR